MSTYCGKDCETCSYKEEMNCSGCMSGPGRMIDGDCKLAHCCRDKGHETCETCMNKRNCGMWLDKGSMARQRKEKAEETAVKREKMQKTAGSMGKWITLMFWMVIPLELAGILTIDKLAEAVPVLDLIGSGIGCVCSVLYAFFLFQISKEHDGYKKSMLAVLGSAVMGLIGLFTKTDALGITAFFGVINLVVSMLAEYFEFHAHADVIEPFDYELAEGWRKIWKWTLYSIIGMFASILIVVIIPLLGLLAVLAMAILNIIAGILKYVYLYRMSKRFSQI